MQNIQIYCLPDSYIFNINKSVERLLSNYETRQQSDLLEMWLPACVEPLESTSKTYNGLIQIL